MNNPDKYIAKNNYYNNQLALIILGLIGIALSFILNNLLVGGLIIALPITGIILFYVLKYPSTLIYILFTLNYFIMGINRYIKIDGISVIIDILLISELIILLIHSSLNHNIEWKYAINALTIISFIWMLYCILEIANPSGMIKTWILSRNLIFNGLLIAIITSLAITRYKQINRIIFLFSIFTLLAICKALIQKYVGFDPMETRWLTESEAYKTHLLYSGTRYFSFYTDAGNFGSNMGFAGITFAIISFYTKNKGRKIYYGIISLLAIYAMFMSGTRGAIAVPLSGLALFTLISKNYKAMLAGGSLLIAFYFFFAFTTIGQSNAMIRRMRSAFTPTKDASFNVRKANQAKLAQYLKNKPFGEGLGLSGVENRKHSRRLTTEIPNDSWYVKIWVETGIPGLIIYIGGLLFVIGRSAWIIMFKIKNKQLRGRLAAIVCGIFGLLVSAYGNPFWGQFPTMIIAFMGLSIALNGERYDKQLEVKKQTI